ncbi:type VI secretion system tip protein TssI/VgrG [Sulfitobacter porphyrae]|uniref:Type VI secretion system tip protein TssI/VgrG n=1 Tax=Sulfitobacter porphyrae TaxID=1246864 RepID=A0ABW2BAW6_9RHOB
MAEIARLFSTLNVALGAIDVNRKRGTERLMSVQDRARSIAALGAAPRIVVQIAEDVLAQSSQPEADSSDDPLTRVWQREVFPLCRDGVMGRYPFGPGADAALADVTALFGPQGAITTFLQSAARPFLETGESPWRWKPEARFAGLNLESAVFLERAAAISRGLFNEAGEMRQDFTLSALAERGQTLFAIGGEAAPVRARGETATLSWPGPAPQAGVEVSFRESADAARIQQPGPWGLLRLVDGVRLRLRDDGARVLLDLRTTSGRVFLNMSFTEPVNLISARRLLNDFSCPRRFEHLPPFTSQPVRWHRRSGRRASPWILAISDKVQNAVYWPGSFSFRSYIQRTDERRPKMSSDRFTILKTPLPDRDREPALLFAKMSGEDAISAPFRFELTCHSSDPDIVANDLLGEPVSLSVLRAGTTDAYRYFHGLVDEFSFQDLSVSEGFYVYRLVLRPAVWFLGRQFDNRIFQHKSVPEIVEDVLGEAGVTDYRLDLTGSYPKREYCVQYGESNLAFVQRLLEHEGIFYYFEFEDGKHCMVIADASSDLAPVGDVSEITYEPDASVIHRNVGILTGMRRSDEVVTGAYAQTDYDFEAPSSDLMALSEMLKEHALDDAEQYSYPGTYIDHGRGKDLADIRLTARQVPPTIFTPCRQRRCRWQGRCSRLSVPRARPRTTSFSCGR